MKNQVAREVKVVFYGLGVIGRQVARHALSKKGLKPVGAVDVAKDLVGKDLGDVLEIGKIGVKVIDDADSLFRRVKADIAIHATVSDLKRVFPQIKGCVNAGLDVVSTCEELSYPYYKHPDLARKLDRLAKANGVTVLGSGINPGYLMDTLPIILTGPCQDVKSIKVTRIMDSGKRRIPFQKKVGEGLTPEEFRRMIDRKEITGHVGLVESIAMVAGALGWRLDEVKELPPEPVIAQREIDTSYTKIQRGQVAGLKSVAYGANGGKSLITLEFVAHAAVEEEYDAVEIDGVPSIRQRIIGGVHGDLGTAAVIVNAIPKVLNAAPGLLAMKDLPPLSAVLGDVRSFLK